MFDNITSICDTMYSEKTNEVAMTNNELKTFMNDLWGAEGDFVDMTGKDNCAWYLFSLETGPTEFIGRS